MACMEMFRSGAKTIGSKRVDLVPWSIHEARQAAHRTSSVEDILEVMHATADRPVVIAMRVTIMATTISWAFASFFLVLTNG